MAATTSASWFSLIIVPQLAPFGSAEKPRKASPAMTAIEYVRRRLASTISGERMLGRISPSRMRGLETPERLGRGDEVALDDRLGRTARDARDARHRRQSDGEHDQPVRHAERRDRDQCQHDLREGQDDVHGAHQDVVEGAARVGGDEADHGSEHESEDRGDRGHDEQLRAAPEEPAPHVLADVVGAEQEVARPGVRLADERGRAVRRDDSGRRRRCATRMPTRISPMRVRHSPSAERSSRVVGWCVAGLSGIARDGRVGDRAHRRVLRRGVTMMVAMSASRLSTT